jgi:hypothetical protein
MRMQVMIINTDRRRTDGQTIHAIKAMRVIPSNTFGPQPDGIVLDVEDSTGETLLDALTCGQVYELTLKPVS